MKKRGGAIVQTSHGRFIETFLLSLQGALAGVLIFVCLSVSNQDVSLNDHTNNFLSVPKDFIEQTQGIYVCSIYFIRKEEPILILVQCAVHLFRFMNTAFCFRGRTTEKRCKSMKKPHNSFFPSLIKSLLLLQYLFNTFTHQNLSRHCSLQKTKMSNSTALYLLLQIFLLTPNTSNHSFHTVL